MTTVISEVQGKLTNLRNITDPLPYCGTKEPSLTLVFGKPGCTGVAPYYSNPTNLNLSRESVLPGMYPAMGKLLFAVPLRCSTFCRCRDTSIPSKA